MHERSATDGHARLSPSGPRADRLGRGLPRTHRRVPGDEPSKAGRGRGAAAGRAASPGRRPGDHLGRPRAHRAARRHALEPPGLVRLLPLQHGPFVGAGGVVDDAASTATLCALLCARERSSDFSRDRGGLQAEEAPLVVYASDQAHSSVPKAALLAGFGADNLRLVETDDDHALRLDVLKAAVREDLAAGRRPCALVAAVGTTATTAIDPLAPMAELAARHGMWLHVDAARAGSAMICAEHRWMWEGVERADSVVLNPHKWICLLYTSDAADEEDSVDLGGRRI